MKFHGRILGFCLLAGALLACFLVVLLRPTKSGTTGDEIVLRFAHWQTLPKTITAYDQVFAEYEAEQARRGVRLRVQQLVVPLRGYPAWLRTQLVGGEPPDLIYLSEQAKLLDELFVRYFLPLTDIVARPNPYNATSPTHAATPWKDTFLDGLQYTGLRENLGDYYLIPLASLAHRLVYNRDLLRSIQGHDRPPITWAEFTTLCEAAIRCHTADGRPVIPLAGSTVYVNALQNHLSTTLSARITDEFDPTGALRSNPFLQTIAAAQGRWSHALPPVAAVLRASIQIGRYTQPGYRQLDGYASLMTFASGQALFHIVFAGDHEVFFETAPFPVGICKTPIITSDDPDYGRFVRGEITPMGAAVFNGFAIARESRHTTAAIDLLQYLSSASVQEKLSRWGYLVPSVRELQPDPSVAAFYQEFNHTYRSGFALASDPKQHSALQQYRYLLDPPRTTPEAFSAATREKLRTAAKEDLVVWQREALRLLRQQDLVIEAHRRLAESVQPVSPTAEKPTPAEHLLDIQVARELDYYWALSETHTTGPRRE